MSMYKGLFTPYDFNRSLTEQEMAHQLHQWSPHPEFPLVNDNNTVIKMNSTYMEVVDRYYGPKGFPSLMMGVPAMVLIGGFILICAIAFNRSILSDTYHWNFNDILWGGIFSAIFIFGIWFCLSITLKEWFRKTHYPIRFNRKTKMVHVYQIDGTILSVPWSKIFFTCYDGVSKTSDMRGWGIDGHILAEDNITVLKTFSLPYYSHWEDLSSYWEFIRCYMEEDVLEDLAKTIYMCPPVANRKEGYIFGLQYQFRYSSKIEYIRLLGLPFTLMENFSRYISMLTSKIPQWPEEVENSCEINPDDPIDVSYKTRNSNLWRYTFACMTEEDYKQKMEAVERIRKKLAIRYKENY
ncbi:hypothetical protein J8V57_16310 [Xenorhabdus sp. PB61.4]|uniref:DUF6708 domain-containing protein n=1 Tax=Xenorhabdus sp. PB61.4 TaxID=2788940 RepID=UPI001E39610D|nr:DUF6708 domain-containing protein [Xenorhabdus sp. PB61.4]MCC8367814.1 hypothetical protein [Xenorhabdus sp. PB61.4]